MKIVGSRHFGSYRQSKLSVTQRKGRNSAVKSSQPSWAEQYKKRVQYDFQFTSEYSGLQNIWKGEHLKWMLTAQYLAVPRCKLKPISLRCISRDIYKTKVINEVFEIWCMPHMMFVFIWYELQLRFANFLMMTILENSEIKLHFSFQNLVIGWNWIQR